MGRICLRFLPVAPGLRLTSEPIGTHHRHQKHRRSRSNRETLMPTGDFLNFEAPDLVNLQKTLRRAPGKFSRAVTGVANTLAFQARTAAVRNIQAATITRNPRFVSASMRVEKARFSRNFRNIQAETFSFDISRSGRSTGFLELEEGGRSKSKRVPTLASRTGGNKQRKVSSGVRMKNLGRFHRHKAFRGKSKQARVAHMLRVARAGKLGATPLVVPAGMSGRMRGMVSGVYKRRRRSIVLMNPFDGKRRATKPIRWMSRAVEAVTDRRNLLKVWRAQFDRIFK